LDRFVLKKDLGKIWISHCEENDEPQKIKHYEDHELVILEDPIDTKIFNRNIIGLGIFFVLLIFIPNILFVGLLGMVLFVFINPRHTATGKRKPDISFYLTKVDFKLVFFSCWL
jgi:hypothetical protein